MAGYTSFRLHYNGYVIIGMATYHEFLIYRTFNDVITIYLRTLLGKRRFVSSDRGAASLPNVTEYAAQAVALRKRAEHLRRCGWAWAGTPTAERIEDFARELESMCHKLDQQLARALLQRAERARRLAREITDTLMVNRLNKYAETLEAQVAQMADAD